METMTANGVTYYQDWEKSEGGIYMVKPKTINRYMKIKEEHPREEAYGVFFAFNKEHFQEGYKSLVKRGYVKDGDKITSGAMGIYGTADEIARFFDFYNERNKRIAKECDPQEVYFYEWNNHECMFGDDDDVVKLIADYFGKEAAHKIHRVGGGRDINILVPITERDHHLQAHEHDLLLLSRLKFDCEGFLSEGDCRHARPSDLWAKDLKMQIKKMRELLGGLPDDIKGESPVTKSDIDDYENMMVDELCKEFCKSKYNPAPDTTFDEYHNAEINDVDLYYQDDDGKWQRPTDVWFSNDSRRWHLNDANTHGRAFTSYLGKHGTTLTPVYYMSWESLTRIPYVNQRFCNVTARYDHKSERLYDFYRE